MRRYVAVGIGAIALGVAGARLVLPLDSASADPNAPLAVTNTSPASAVAGQDGVFLKIYGDGFPSMGGSIYITWNGEQMGASVKSSTEIQVQVPATVLQRPGQATISLFHSNGQSVSMPQKFLITHSSSDTDCNGVANAADALFVLHVVAALKDEDAKCSADANRNGIIDMNDALWIRQELANQVDPLPR